MRTYFFLFPLSFGAAVVFSFLATYKLPAQESGLPRVETERVPGYRGIWFTLGQQLRYGDKYSGGLGTYTANHVPMAVHSPARDRTFFVYGGTPAAEERRLLIMASYFDHRTGTVPQPVKLMEKEGVNDPHDNPSINLDGGGHLWIFVSGRSTRRPGYIFRSEQPYEIGAFRQVAEVEMTYPQPWWVPGQGWLLLFTKYTAGRELYWKTSADGIRWSEDQKLAGFRGHYQVSGAHGGKVATFFNYHPDGNVDRRTNLYYLETTDMGRTWMTAGGHPVSLPLDEKRNPALVLDLEEEGRLMYTCDLNFDRNGNPILLYVESRSGQPGPPGLFREWKVAHWNGSEWRRHRVAYSDHNYDMGSLYIEGETWKVIAPTGKGPQPFATGGEVEIWSSRDEGRSWTLDRRVTTGSEFNHTYVRRPLNARDPFYAYWADGNPLELSPSRLYFTDSRGERFWKLPYTMQAETVQPDKAGLQQAAPSRSP